MRNRNYGHTAWGTRIGRGQGGGGGGERASLLPGSANLCRATSDDGGIGSSSFIRKVCRMINWILLATRAYPFSHSPSLSLSLSFSLSLCLASPHPLRLPAH